jgi:hypothetical protein
MMEFPAAVSVFVMRRKAGVGWTDAKRTRGANRDPADRLAIAGRGEDKFPNIPPWADYDGPTLRRSVVERVGINTREP